MYALQSLRGVFVITYLISLTLCDTGKYHASSDNVDMYALQSLRGVFVITYLISLTLCDTEKYHASSDNVYCHIDTLM